MADRITYQGAYVKANDKTLYRISSFGSSTNIPKEKLNELGNAGEFFVADDVATIDVSLEGREWGSLHNLLALAGKDEASKYVHIRKDFENAKTNFIMPVKVNDGVWTQFILDSFLTSYNLSYNVSGDSTEGFSLSANHKYWYKDLIDVEEQTYSESIVFENTGELKHVQIVDADGKVTTLEDTDYTYETNTLTLNEGIISAKVRGIFLASGGTYPAFTTKQGKGTTRRAEIEAYLVRGHNLESFNTDPATNALSEQEVTKLKLDKVQTLSIDASLDREDLYELGRLYPYFKALVLPLNITVNMDFIAADNDILGFLMGEDSIDTMSEFDVNKIKDDIGLYVLVYEDKEKTKILRSVEIPQLLINSEGFNLATDGNGTNNFGFTGEDLVIIDKTK